jgi:hypothetical protein
MWVSRAHDTAKPRRRRGLLGPHAMVRLDRRSTAAGPAGERVHAGGAWAAQAPWWASPVPSRALVPPRAPAVHDQVSRLGSLNRLVALS